MVGPKKLQLFRSFHSFRDDTKLETSCHADHCGNDGGILAFGTYLPDE